IKAGTGTAGAALSGTATVAATNGVATFSGLSIDKSGASYQLHATDGVLTAADSSAFSVTVGAAAKLAITQQPSSSTGGTAFATQPKVTVQDAGGNTVTTDSSTLTLAIGTNPGGGSLSGCSSSETSGVFTLSGCKIDKTGTGYTLHATDASLTATDSSSFNITVGSAAQIAFTQQPSSSSGGTALPTQPQPTPPRRSSDLVTSDSSTLTLAIGTNPGGGSLSGCSSSETSGVFT